MRRFISLAAAVVALAVVPSTAGAAIVHAEGGAGARGHKLLWTLDYDTASKDVTLDVTHTQFDGSPAIGDPQQADLVVIQPNGTERDFDLLTLTNPNDGQPGVINDGPLTFNLPGGLRVSANRAAMLDFRTDYTPPLGA